MAERELRVLPAPRGARHWEVARMPGGEGSESAGPAAAASVVAARWVGRPPPGDLVLW